MWALSGSFFMLSNFYRLDLLHPTRVALPDLQWNICKNRINNRTSPASLMVIGSACLLVSKLETQVLPITCFHYRVQSVFSSCLCANDRGRDETSHSLDLWKVCGGLKWLVLHALQLLPVGSTPPNSCRVIRSTMKHL